MTENYFTTNLNIEENTINISIGSNHSYLRKDLLIEIRNNGIFFYSEEFTFNEPETSYWVRPIGITVSEFISVDIHIKHDNKIIFTEFHKIGEVKKRKIALFINKIGAMADTFFAEPTIRKLSQIYNQKIRVYTHHPKLFFNHPCIESLVQLDTYYSYQNYESNITDEERNEYTVFYTSLYHKLYGNNFVPHWPTIDLRQMCALQCGFTLLPEESSYNFYPYPYIDIPELPEKYVCINPSYGSVVTWKNDKWQELIDRLNTLGINVVLIGHHDIEYERKLNKGLEINLRKGLDLRWKTDLSQAWHIINKSDLFICNQSLMPFIASSTDTNILVVGSNYNPKYQAPYRNGRQDYKFYTINNFCEYQYCISDMSQSLKKSKTGLSNFEDIIIGDGCQFDGESNHNCIPTVEQVYDKVMEILVTPIKS